MAARAKFAFDQYSMFEPQSEWVPPISLPDLSRETEIAIDTETRDDSLAKNTGPGFYAFDRNNHNTGYICGISLAWRNQSIYIPLRHYDTHCFNQDTVQRWLVQLATQNSTRFIFHNFQYDWGWLEAVFGVKPPTLIDDTALMASMVDENRFSFSLDSLCAWQNLPGKDEKLLKEYMADKRVPANKIKENLWKAPGKYVGPYAEQDAASTLNLAGKLRSLLVKENLEYAYNVECELMPITLKMKQHGIRVNISRTEELSRNILNKCKEEENQLSSALGKKVTIREIRSNRWLKQQFDEIGLQYPKTAASETYLNGQASFEKSFMANHQHWFPRTVHKIKHQTDLAERFLKKFILNYQYRGRVFPTVNQFRSETGGARSHRFSYADPPLQQMPSRDDEYASLIRSCFLPESGQYWCGIDYRQQEYRLIVFVAELLGAKGAKRAADMYRNDPETDFHNYVAEITKLPRRRAKDVNFAKSYGAGVAKFALMTGMSEDEARATMAQYDEELPFVKIAADRYSYYATTNGFIKLIDGARNHFNLWEPMYRDFSGDATWRKQTDAGLADTAPCHEDEAKCRFNDTKHPWYREKLKRSYTHKAFNRMIQGSAARQIKKAMVDLHKAGYRALLQIHDELGFSLTSQTEAFRCAKLMEEAMPQITIPMTTDIKWGNNWGQTEKIIE